MFSQCFPTLFVFHFCHAMHAMHRLSTRGRVAHFTSSMRRTFSSQLKRCKDIEIGQYSTEKLRRSCGPPCTTMQTGVVTASLTRCMSLVVLLKLMPEGAVILLSRKLNHNTSQRSDAYRNKHFRTSSENSNASFDRE